MAEEVRVVVLNQSSSYKQLFGIIGPPKALLKLPKERF